MKKLVWNICNNLRYYLITYGFEVCNVGVQRNKKKNNSFYLTFILNNIDFAYRFSDL